MVGHVLHVNRHVIIIEVCTGHGKAYAMRWIMGGRESGMGWDVGCDAIWVGTCNALWVGWNMGRSRGGIWDGVEYGILGKVGLDGVG